LGNSYILCMVLAILSSLRVFNMALFHLNYAELSLFSRLNFESLLIAFDQKLRSRFDIERHPYTKAALAKFRVYVCIYMCVTTPPKPLNRFA